jgi:MFS superfamily sulfate permease-like transporter
MAVHDAQGLAAPVPWWHLFSSLRNYPRQWLTGDLVAGLTV